MNIGLLIRGAKSGAKLAGRAAKATGRGAKAGAKAAASKTKAAAKAAGKSKVAQSAKKVGGKVAEGVGYAATPGLRRSAKRGVRYFKKGKGTSAIKSVSRAKVRSTGKKVIGGAAVVGTGAAVNKGRKPTKEAVKGGKPAPGKTKAVKQSGNTAATRKAPIKFGAKVAPSAKGAKPKAIDKSKLKPSAPRGASSAGSRFDNMTPAQIKRLRGKNKLMYRAYLARKNK